jgi:putative MATE family efflux protein
VLRAAGDAITPLKILALSTALNIGLDPLLIFGLWGLPRLGVAGSALATVTARGIGTLILLWIFLRGRAVVRLRMTNAKVDFSLMWRIIKIGVFASIQAIMRNISGLVLMPIVANYGTFAVAAYGIGMRLRMIVMMPGFGLATAVSTLVGQNLGASKPERAERTAWVTVSITAGIMTFFGIVYIVFSRSIIGTFNEHPEVIRIGVNYMYIIAGTFGFIGLSVVLGRALNGAGDTISPMIITAIGFIGFRVSLSLLFSSKLGLKGVWFGIAASTIIQGLIMIFWFNTGRWKLKQI